MAVHFRSLEIAPSFLALAVGIMLTGLMSSHAVQAQRNAVVERASSTEFGPGPQANWRTTLGFETQSFATTIPDRPNLGSSTLLKLGVQYETGKEDWGGKLDFTAGRYVDLRYNTLSVREAYVSYGKIFNPKKVTSSQMNFSLGRKIEFWSEVDNQWDLGLWEPKYLEEPLRPEKQGIAGLQFNFQDPSGIDFAAYVSPIFIPTMNPPLAVEEGAFVSDSRWTRPPSSSTSLIGKDTRLVYDLQIPEISQLISKPGSGARLSWGRQRSEGFWLSTNFARKPINALSLKYDYKLAISSASAEGMVNVGPTVS